MTKYYIDSYGSESLLLHNAFDLIMELAKSSALRQAAVAVEDRNQILSNGNWREVLTERYIIPLSKGRTAIDKCKIFLITKRQIPLEFTKGPVLAYNISLFFLKTILENPQATDIIFVPQRLEDLESFKRNNQDAICF